MATLRTSEVYATPAPLNVGRQTSDNISERNSTVLLEITNILHRFRENIEMISKIRIHNWCHHVYE
jgi:hypothetical protein